MLVESDKIFTKDAKNPGNVNTFFLNTVKNPLLKKSHAMSKPIFKYNNIHVLVLMMHLRK